VLTSLATPTIYRALLDSMTEGVSLSDEAGTIIYTNAAEDDLFGYHHGELVGLHLSVQNAYPDEENQRRVDEVIRHLQEHGFWHGEWTNRRKDGSIFVTASRITAVEIDERPHWLCVQRDVTAQLEAERLLRESEERLRLATEGTGVGTYDLDLSTGEGIWSEQAFALLGMKPTTDFRASFALWRDVVHTDDVAGLEVIHARAGKTPGPWRAEYRIQRADDGFLRWLEAIGQFRISEDGRIRSLGVVSDITDRKLTEIALAESESRLRRSQQAGGVGSYEWELQGEAGHQSETMLRIIGLELGRSYSLREIIGRVHKPDLPKVFATVQAIGEGELQRETQYRVHGADGELRWIRDIGQVERDESGRPVRWVGIVQDITEQKRLEAEMQSLNEGLEHRVKERTAELERVHEQLRQSQKLEAMGQLTGGVAHDFNNLLTPILGSLDLLVQKPGFGEREQRLLRAALESAERAKTLVQRLLAFARRQPLKLGPVDIASLIEGMIELVASTSGPRIRVSTGLEEGLPAAIAEPNQLEMALLNLCVNARDAMPNGGELSISARKIAVAAGAMSELIPGDYVLLSVSDTGQGMPPNIAAKAIEPFFSTKGVGRGTGLGLSMVHGLALQLGGAMSIKSKLGLGTTIELYLAVAQTSLAASDVVAASASGAELREGTVLLVDDEASVRTSTAEMLIELGYKVRQAESAAEALGILEGWEPKLLVTDHLMPGMTGTELAQMVRKSHPGTSVLVISGYADIDGLPPELPRLSKPFRKHELASALASLHPSGS
jgi:PAS domain S-box-containing protein